MLPINQIRSLLLSGLMAVGLISVPAHAQTLSRVQHSRENLMVVLRESIGVNRLDETLTPTGKMKARLPNGQDIEIEMAHWDYIGDMHVRFVFDGPHTMENATPQELEALNLSNVHDALAVAIANIKRIYGEPSVTAWNNLMSIEGKLPDLNSSYFLDREFWRKLLQKHPEGVVASVPKRGGLLYAPLSDVKAVDSLGKAVGYLHASSERLRISSALYLFKDDKWAVFQSPQKPM
jgi:hypothetical protein